MTLAQAADVLSDEEAARRALESAYASGREINPALTSAQVWAIAIDALLADNQIEAVGVSLPHLLKAFPNLLYFRTLTHVFEQLPPKRGNPFFNDPVQAVQLVASPGADTIVFAFTGIQHRLMLEMNLFHRWMAELDVHVVYLRESETRLFREGIPSIATDYPGTLSAFEQLAVDLGAKRICCLGTCQGGHAALQYGIDLRAERVLAYSPITFVAAADIASATQQSDQAEIVAARQSDVESLDLRLAFQRAAHHPLSRIVFGGENKRDASRARHLADLPKVILEPLPGVRGHNSVHGSLSSNRFTSQLAWMAGRQGSA